MYIFSQVFIIKCNAVFVITHLHGGFFCSLRSDKTAALHSQGSGGSDAPVGHLIVISAFYRSSSHRDASGWVCHTGRCSPLKMTQTHTTSTASDSCVSEISSVLTLPAVKSAGYDFDLNNLIKRSADSKNTPVWVTLRRSIVPESWSKSCPQKPETRVDDLLLTAFFHLSLHSSIWLFKYQSKRYTFNRNYNYYYIWGYINI